MYLPHRDVEDNVEDFVHGLKDRIRIGVQTVLHRDPTRNTLEDAFGEAQQLDESIYNPSNGAVRTLTGPRPMELGQLRSVVGRGSVGAGDSVGLICGPPFSFPTDGMDDYGSAGVRWCPSGTPHPVSSCGSHSAGVLSCGSSNTPRWPLRLHSVPLRRADNSWYYGAVEGAYWQRHGAPTPWCIHPSPWK